MTTTAYVTCCDGISSRVCTNATGGTYGDSWRYDFGVFSDRANAAGVDASQICCACSDAPIYSTYACPPVDNLGIQK